MPFKIAILVHGRFHAFDLARELLKRGHDVTLFTNYPAFVVRRFGIPRERVRSFLTHGIVSRVAWRLAPSRFSGDVERVSNLAFARWGARRILADKWDVVVAFSGIAEETFQGLLGHDTLRVLQRGSAHICVQREILQEERDRIGEAVEVPSDWIVARELREYALADIVHVLSGFAGQSFLDHGVHPSRLFHLTLGVNTARFRATEEVVARRCARILAGEPLRILNVGTFCCRKGASDWVEVIDRLAGPRFQFRFVGPVGADAAALTRRLRGKAEFTGKFPQDRLPGQYEWGDVFVLPTLEDGFAAVLTQALAAGLPLITTPHCAGPELIDEGENGWLMPVRDVSALAERLVWLEEHREELVRAVRTVQGHPRHFDWAETARQAEENFVEARILRQESSSEEARHV